jgi:hypothetical protein
MRTNIALFVTLIAALAACKNESGSTSASSSASASASPSAFASAPASASAAASASASTPPPLPPFAFSAASDPSALDGGAVRDPYAEIDPKAASPDLVRPDVAVGFSKDDVYLGYFVSTCDPCPGEYRFEGSNGVKPLVLSYFYDPSLDSDVQAKKRKANDDALEAKLKELGVEPAKNGRKLRGPFPYADLTFETKTSEGPRPGWQTRWLGARVVTLPKEPPVFPLRADVAPHMMFDKLPKEEKARIDALPPDEKKKALKEWRDQFTMSEPALAYANVTHDGSEIGIVAVSHGSMWYEDGAVARMKTAAFAARVYNDTAMRRMRANDYATAALLFEKAARAHPAESLYSYNLACGLARTHDARAKDALARAVVAAGDQGDDVKKRATKDPDFESVKTEPWFTEATRVEPSRPP